MKSDVHRYILISNEIKGLVTIGRMDKINHQLFKPTIHLYPYSLSEFICEHLWLNFFPALFLLEEIKMASLFQARHPKI